MKHEVVFGQCMTKKDLLVVLPAAYDGLGGCHCTETPYLRWWRGCDGSDATLPVPSGRGWDESREEGVVALVVPVVYLYGPAVPLYSSWMICADENSHLFALLSFLNHGCCCYRYCAWCLTGELVLCFVFLVGSMLR